MPNQPASDQPVITVRDLTKTFRRRTVVDRVSFDVARGEIVGFLGPNGAGKTTLMNIVMGLVAPDHGAVSLFGIEAGFRRKDVLARIGHLQEKPRVYPDMTARAYLAFFGELYGIPSVKRRIGEVLDRVGLSDAADKRLSTFSRGMQQRACLARVMLHRPELLILDEPTLGLDPNGLAEMRAIFLDMRASGTTLFFSSHQLAEMDRIADSLVFMQDGKLIAKGSQQDLLAGNLTGQASADTASLTIELFEPASAHIATIRAIPTIATARQTGSSTIDITLANTTSATDIRQARANIANDITAKGLTLLAITTATTTLEDMFLRLTAKSDAQGSTPTAQDGRKHDHTAGRAGKDRGRAEDNKTDDRELIA